ncbi:MAG: DUF3089 domain-containing protein, partial [Myxococcota bacterium]
MLACIAAGTGCGDDDASVDGGTAVSDASPDGMTPADASTTGDGLDYTDRDLWLCHPDLGASDDVCRSAPLDVTDVADDGTATIRTIERATDPSFDCFYVYPTVSDDEGDYSDLVPDAEIGVTFLQAARYGELCELYAPLYRQVTVAALPRSVADSTLLDTAYADVLGAFVQYLAERPGRPFLLLGHSQGSGLLARLLQEEIETSPALSERLVAAHLIGPYPSIVVPWDPETGAMEVAGGTFSSTPLCAAADQPGCVVTFSSYRATEPAGVGAFFAVPRPGATPPLIGACTHPAALGGGTAPLSDTWANGAAFEIEDESDFSEFGPYVDPASNEALTTAFFAMPGLLSGACEIQSG